MGRRDGSRLVHGGRPPPSPQRAACGRPLLPFHPFEFSVRVMFMEATIPDFPFLGNIFFEIFQAPFSRSSFLKSPLPDRAPAPPAGPRAANASAPDRTPTREAPSNRPYVGLVSPPDPAPCSGKASPPTTPPASSIFTNPRPEIRCRPHP